MQWRRPSTSAKVNGAFTERASGAAMADPVQPSRHAHVHAAIERAAAATGVDFSLLVETARRESALNPTARAATSSATGLFQFIESTWLDMVRRHGGEHGLGAYAQQIGLRNGRAYVADPAARAEILALRNDPDASARMAGELARENANQLATRLGRAPSAGELYAAHVMGPAGAVRLINAAQEGAPSAAAIFPAEAAANRGLFYANGAPVSAQALLNRFSIDADAAMGAPQQGVATGETRYAGEMSPELAQALFAIALLPLLRGGQEEQSDPLQALNAYARAQRGGAI